MKAPQLGETVVETATYPDEAWEKASGLARVIRVMGWQDSYGVTVQMMGAGSRTISWSSPPTTACRTSRAAPGNACQRSCDEPFYVRGPCPGRTSAKWAGRAAGDAIRQMSDEELVQRVREELAQLAPEEAIELVDGD